MKKILVITYGSIDHASSRTRIIQYFDTLIAHHFSILFLPQRPIVKQGISFYLYRFLFKKIQAIKKTWCLAFCKIDVVFVNRFLLSRFDLFLIKFRKFDFIFDFDDAIYLRSIKNEEKVIKQIKSADNVIVSTSY